MQRFTYSLHEVFFCFVEFMMKREAVDMNHWEMVFPNKRVSIVEKTNEDVQELDCIHRKVHVAMIEAEKIFRNSSL